MDGSVCPVAAASSSQPPHTHQRHGRLLVGIAQSVEDQGPQVGEAHDAVVRQALRPLEHPLHVDAAQQGLVGVLGGIGLLVLLVLQLEGIGSHV